MFLRVVVKVGSEKSGKSFLRGAAVIVEGELWSGPPLNQPEDGLKGDSRIDSMTLSGNK